MHVSSPWQKHKTLCVGSAVLASQPLLHLVMCAWPDSGHLTAAAIPEPLITIQVQSHYPSGQLTRTPEIAHIVKMCIDDSVIRKYLYRMVYRKFRLSHLYEISWTSPFKIDFLNLMFSIWVFAIYPQE